MNNAIIKTSRNIPKSIIEKISKPYLAGETLECGLKRARELNKKGFACTLDLLGEEITNKDETLRIKKNYFDLIEGIADSKIDSNVSLKLTSIGLKIDSELCWANLKEILDKAKKTNNFVRFDMEDSSVTQSTIEMYEKANIYYKNCGTVLQAYLHRTQNDINDFYFNDLKNIRLCKGSYRESGRIAYQDYRVIRENYISCSKMMLNSNIYSCFATHDEWIIDFILKYIEENEIPKTLYEFQSLIGVPIEDKLQTIVNNGHKVRYYIPYGSNWYEYSLRRVQENPDVWKNILSSQIFRQIRN